MQLRWRLIPALALAAPLYFAATFAASAQTAPDAMFKGKTLTVVVPAGPGGTFHLYAQILSRHLGRHVPGNPAIIVQNRPGAGGATSAVYMTKVAPKDGTVIAEMVPGMVTDPLVRASGYDPLKFQYLGAMAARDYSIVVWHTVPIRSLDDLRKTEVTIGATGRADPSYAAATFMNGLLGTKMKIIAGYGSGGDMNIALERGEVQGRGNFYSGFTGVRPDWVRDNKIRFLLTFGPKNPALANVPRVRDLLKPGSIEMKTFDLLEANFLAGQAFYLPPGVPADRLAVLRKAFADAMKDPALKKECEDRKVDYGPIGAEALQRIVSEGLKPASDPAVVEKFRAFMAVGKS